MTNTNFTACAISASAISPAAHLCKGCGAAVTKYFSSGKPSKYCSACNDKNQGRHRACSNVSESECAQCRKPFMKSRSHQKFCSGACRSTARDRANGMAPKAYIVPRQCPNCSQTFKPRTSRSSTYCSRECAFAFMAAAPFCVIWAGDCKGCGTTFVARRKRTYCSTSCHAKPVWKSTAPEYKHCLACHARYKPITRGGAPSEYCSDECRDSVTSKRKRIDKAKRRALLASVKVENVDPFKVFDRDGWKCQLCGVKTPRAKRGTYDDDAPELDHIVALARGGAHSYLNTQCACRKCNSLKSDRSMGQLLLLG